MWQLRRVLSSDYILLQPTFQVTQRLFYIHSSLSYLWMIQFKLCYNYKQICTDF